MMKFPFQVGLVLIFAMSALPIDSAQADAQLSVSERQHIWARARDIVSVGIENDFQNGNIPNRELVRFGIYQVALRQPNLFQNNNSNGTTRVSDKFVAAAAMRYFGKVAQHQSVGEWEYHNGFYNGYSELFEQLGDEKINGFRIESATKNRLTVYVNYENSMASTDADRMITTRAKLSFKPALVQGKRRYILNSFVHLSPKS